MTRPALIFLATWVCACGGSSSGGDGNGGSAGATGGSAGATGGSAGATGGSAGTGGGGGDCATLLSEYAKAVGETKTCTLGAANACTAAVDTSISGCGYYQYGDSSNTGAFAKLVTLKDQWKATSCKESPGGCALGGFPPVTAECTAFAGGAGGTSGKCTPK